MTTIELSEQRKAEIFERRIKRRFLHAEQGAALPGKPEFAIFGGQPGAGKSGVLTTTTADMRTRGATWSVNADDFAVYHPSYKQLQKEHGAAAADMVRGVTSGWVKQTIEAAQQRQVNVVFESTMRQPDLVKQTIGDFRSKGYNTHAIMLAVSPEVSWQGNNLRRENLAATGAPSRLATREAHDAAVSGSVQTIEKLEKDRAVDRLTIVNRSGDTLYRNELVAGDWKNAPQAAATLQAYRAQPMQPDAARVHDRNWEQIEKMASARHARDKAPAQLAKSEIHDIRAARSADAVTHHLQSVDGGKSAQQIRTQQREPTGPDKGRA